MAGQLTIDTLKASTGVLATQNGMTGICKAWLNYNGVAQTVTGSFNVSSVTYNGTGDYTVNFTTAMPNANYSSVFGGTNAASGTGRDQNIGVKNNTAPTTTALRIAVFEPNTGNVNALYVNVAILSS